MLDGCSQAPKIQPVCFNHHNSKATNRFLNQIPRQASQWQCMIRRSLWPRGLSSGWRSPLQLILTDPETPANWQLSRSSVGVPFSVQPAGLNLAFWPEGRDLGCLSASGSGQWLLGCLGRGPLCGERNERASGALAEGSKGHWHLPTPSCRLPQGGLIGSRSSAYDAGPSSSRASPGPQAGPLARCGSARRGPLLLSGAWPPLGP